MKAALVLDGATFFDVIRLRAAEHPWRQSQSLHGPVGRPFNPAVSVLNRIQGCWAQAFALHWEKQMAAHGCERQPTWPAAIRAARLHSPLAISDLRRICAELNRDADDYYWQAGSIDGDWATSGAPQYVRPCHGCRRMFYLSDVRRTLCNGCRTRSERDKKRRQRGTDLSPRSCACCGDTFTPRRSDASCCSGKCRARLSRQRQAPPRPEP